MTFSLADLAEMYPSEREEVYAALLAATRDPEQYGETYESYRKRDAAMAEKLGMSYEQMLAGLRSGAFETEEMSEWMWIRNVLSTEPE